ncbi:hypothetical protein T4B_10500 [Trichinella pseudospiralis]|uniref:Uncharacterized protein n=1 Tax=Trichinella pseudospiralis TaxID=6337 RepID=A0A0V1ISG6_TRIPS|nr:hypothetical protein T4B_10500 [Trichinella pseudospiralis]
MITFYWNFYDSISTPASHTRRRESPLFAINLQYSIGFFVCRVSRVKMTKVMTKKFGLSIGLSVGRSVGWLLYICGDICTWSERVLAGAIGLLLTVVIVQGSSLSGSTRVDDRRIAVSISGHSYYWFGCSAQKILSFSGSVDLMK